MLNPEKRPLPIRLYNAIIPQQNLQVDKLLNTAYRHTQLRDLGPDFNMEAVEVLVQSINDEARLNAFGTLMIREKLIGQLENRLWATHWFKKYPEILDTEVLPIALITGVQRTGSTKMQRLLSALPGARPLMSWEALYPAPIGSKEETSKRIARTKRNAKAVKWISPTFQSIHPIYYDRPEEDVLLLDVHFMSSSSEAIMHVPAYASWLTKQNPKPAYLYEEKLLKLLQWQQPGEFWVLKSPHHLEYLDVFHDVFTNTKVIWTHRDIEQCIPSYLSMLYYGRRMFSDEVSLEEIKHHWVNKLSGMIDAGLDFREKHPERIKDIAFADFMSDEQQVIAEVANFLSINDGENDMFSKVKQDRYVSKHRYQLSDWSLSSEEIEQKFMTYNGLMESIKKKPI